MIDILELSVGLAIGAVAGWSMHHLKVRALRQKIEDQRCANDCLAVHIGTLTEREAVRCKLTGVQ